MIIFFRTDKPALGVLHEPEDQDSTKLTENLDTAATAANESLDRVDLVKEDVTDLKLKEAWRKMYRDLDFTFCPFI